MPKVVPIRRNFEDVRALLAAMADMDLAGFVGVVIMDDGSMQPVSFGATPGDYAFAGTVLQKLAMEDGDVST